MLDAEFWIVGKEKGTGVRPSAFAKATADKAIEATGPLFRPFFSLPKNHVNKMLRACDPRDCARGEAITRPLLNDALEHDSRVRGFRRRRSEGAPSIGRSGNSTFWLELYGQRLGFVLGGSNGNEMLTKPSNMPSWGRSPGRCRKETRLPAAGSLCVSFDLASATQLRTAGNKQSINTR